MKYICSNCGHLQNEIGESGAALMASGEFVFLLL